MKQFFLKIRNSSTKTAYSIPIRFAVGLILLHAGFDKISTDSFTALSLKKSIDSWYVFIPWDFYRNFLNVVVFPYIKYVYYLLIGGEIFAGVSILLGFKLRWGSFIAFIISVNYYLMLSWQNSVTAGFYLLLLTSSLSLALINPGSLLGFDSGAKK